MELNYTDPLFELIDILIEVEEDLLLIGMVLLETVGRELALKL